jgi:hypothetical protein
MVIISRCVIKEERISQKNGKIIITENSRRRAMLT